jgi:hypothetical protein
LPFYFKHNLLKFSFFQIEEEKKKKKIIGKKRTAKKGGSFPLSFYSTLSLLAPFFALPLLPFCFKPFLLASFYFQAKEKKNHREEKKCREGRELSF